MSVQYYHGLCERYRGRAVAVRTHEGRTYRGIIERTNGRHVFLRPIESQGLGGFGYGFYGYGPGFYGYGRGYRIALGAIAAISLVSLAFW